MKELVILLQEQNALMITHNTIIENSLGEFKRILELQAAEAKLGNARTSIMDATLHKLLVAVCSLGQQSSNLLVDLENRADNG